MKPWRSADDTQRWLHQSYPLEQCHRAQITYKGTVRAVLSGDDPDELKARAHRFAAGQRWRGAVVTVTR